jgi:hypothetical protein
MDYAHARIRANCVEAYTVEELDEALDRLAKERDVAQKAIGLIRAEKAKRLDAELQELRAARKAKEGSA